MASERERYNNKWWGAAEKSEREQFIAGYLDCAIFDHGDKSLLSAQWNLIEPKISKYYSNNPKTNAQVASLIARFSSRLTNDPAPEVDNARYGIFDGDYWWQLTETGRRGFVKGYLACYQSGRDEQAADRHSIDWYVGGVSLRYCIAGLACADEQNGQNARAIEKIADILHRL
jgi:hypothetical protein